MHGRKEALTQLVYLLLFVLHIVKIAFAVQFSGALLMHI